MCVVAGLGALLSKGVVHCAFLDGQGAVLALAHLPGVVQNRGVGGVARGYVFVGQVGVEEG